MRGHPIRCREMGNIRLIAGDPASVGSKPNGAIGSADHCDDPVVGQSISFGEVDEALSVEMRSAAPRKDPKISLGFPIRGENDSLDETIGAGERFDVAARIGWDVVP